MNEHYLFISNHRDIVLDSSLLNYHLYMAGHDTSRMAVGDNLLHNELAADLMRLNKSFVVERSVSGAKAVLQVLTRTSEYIRCSLEEGVSIWIAQREGRAKDGWDRTEPAVLKMLALAHKDADDPLNALFERCRVVPVSVSYELDPCAVKKAHELFMMATEGSYAKSAREDVESIVTGLVGAKGRVHLHYGDPVCGPFASPEAAAAALDRAIVSGLRVFPTHVEAARLLGDADLECSPVAPIRRISQRFLRQCRECPVYEREYLLLQYANLLRNRRAIAQDPGDTSMCAAAQVDEVGSTASVP